MILKETIEKGKFINEEEIEAVAKEYMTENDIYAKLDFNQNRLIGENYKALYQPSKDLIIINYERLLNEQKMIFNTFSGGMNTLEALQANLIILKTLIHELKHVDQNMIITEKKESNPIIKELLCDTKEYMIRQYVESKKIEVIKDTKKMDKIRNYYNFCPLEYNANFESYACMIEYLNKYKELYPEHVKNIRNNKAIEYDGFQDYMINPNFYESLLELYFKHNTMNEKTYEKISPVSNFYQNYMETKDMYDIVNDKNYELLDGYQRLAYGFPITQSDEMKLYGVFNIENNVKEYFKR